MSHAAVPVLLHRRAVALRAGLAAALVLGVAAALPSSAATGSYVDETGFLQAPAPLIAAGEFTPSFTCPEPPPDQGVDIWVYALPDHAAVEGAAVTITGRDASGPVSVRATVFKDDCAYDRRQLSGGAGRPTTFELLPGDRFFAVATDLGVQTALRLTITGEGVTQEAPAPAPSASSGTSPAVDGTVMTRRSYPLAPNDPLFLERSTAAASFELQGQWGMRTIRAPQAWQQPQATGAGVRVAVLDSGLDVDHPDFRCPGKIARVNPEVFPRFADVTDTDGHGTHVAGIVGACTDNGEGVAGTAPDATILPIQALSPTEATAERLGAAIRAAVDSGAHVINMSLGFGAHSAVGTAASEISAYAETVEPALAHARRHGVVVVAAAGNSSFPICGYPALAQDVVCVGSTDRRDLNAWYGNFPVTPYGAALVAPGGSGTVALLACNGGSEGVLSTYSRAASSCTSYAGYSALDGTSMASPHVAGVAALVYDRLGAQRSPEAAARVVQALIDGAKDLYAPGYDPISGEGRVDALGAVTAVEAVSPSPSVSPPSPSPPSPSPSATASPSAAASPASTALELVAPATGQVTDELALAARLSDEAGPVAGADVLFRLVGQGEVREVPGRTDDRGVARAAQLLDLPVGAYQLSAAYAGSDGRRGSFDDQPFEILRDDSTMTVTTSGKGTGRTVTATLADADTPSSGVTGATVVFLADGTEAGTAVTDARGTATYTPTGSARGAKTFEARFAGDGRYHASAGRVAA